MTFSILLVTLAILLGVMLTIRPLRYKKLVIGMALGPIFLVLLLFALQVIDFETIKSGIIGHGQPKPWEIIVIFFTVAYVSISVDVTGFFDFLAYKIVQKANGSSTHLFLFFYLFAGFLSVFTSNDIVILTLTPLIFYLGKHAKVNVIPLLFAEFFGANTLSMFFYIDNPTNIIIVNALDIGFFEYTKVMAFPTVVAAVANYVLLVIFFRKKIKGTFTLHKSAKFHVRNWLDVVLSVTLLIGMFVMLALNEVIGAPIWVITSVFAGVFIFEDIIFGIYYHYKAISLSHVQKKKKTDVYFIPEEKNEFLITLRRIPWKILPFIISFFILVEALNQFGAIDFIASGLASVSQTLFASIASMGVLGIVLANLINNQPMSILLSNVLISDHFAVTESARLGSAYALIAASNLGANITIIGALAGLMWKKILSTKGIEISYWDFIKVGIVVTPAVFAVTLLSIYFVLS